jgi:Glycosyl hydrolases family 39
MRRVWSIGLCALAALAVLSAILLAADDPARPPQADRPPPPRAADLTVTAFLDSPRRTRGSMNGFIHALDATSPDREWVAPLAPRLWRSDIRRAPVGRAMSLGAHYQLVLSDLWGYPGTGWEGKGPPWADLARWERFVRRVARENRERPVSWDIWNEPDADGFWRGGQRRFYRVYSVANRVLREELEPGAVIGGPSFSRYSPRRLRAFLDHCLRERCRVDFLSWHENIGADEALESISSHLRRARSQLVENPRYAALGMREIHVNEYVGLEDRHLPGEAATYLDQLERGGADLAARACWDEADCSPTGLNGMLANGSPRAVWWVHRWYAAGAGARVRSRSGDAAVTALASTGQAGAQVLLGNAPRRGPRAPAAKGGLAVRLSLRGGPLMSAPVLRVTAERVPAAGGAPVPAPETMLDRAFSPEEGALTFTLPPLGAHEAMLVSVKPG